MYNGYFLRQMPCKSTNKVPFGQKSSTKNLKLQRIEKYTLSIAFTFGKVSFWPFSRNWNTFFSDFFSVKLGQGFISAQTSASSPYLSIKQFKCNLTFKKERNNFRVKNFPFFSTAKGQFLTVWWMIFCTDSMLQATGQT